MFLMIVRYVLWPMFKMEKYGILVTWEHNFISYFSILFKGRILIKDGLTSIEVSPSLCR